MSKSVTRLFKSFRPEHYEVRIQPDANTMRFTGTVVIHGKKVGRPSQRFTFHQNGLTVTKAEIIKHEKKDDLSIPVSRINLQKSLHEVRLHTTETLHAGSYSVRLEFEAPITKGMTGLYPCYFKHDGEEHIILATQFESHHAREVLPCIDEPEAKATFDLSVTHPSSFTALGNSPVKHTQKIDDTTSETTFETSPRMSSYLLAFVIGELHKKSTVTSSGVDVNIWASVAQPSESFDFALDTAKRSIEFFEEYFGVPYPLPKADHVALPDFSSLAMENWGLITYRELGLLLYPDQVSQSSKELIALVIAHETSHQWFGNLVTMKWWDDLWLNESFASIMEYQAMDAMFPEWNCWNSFITNDGLSAWRRDAIAGVQPVRVDVNHPDEISTLFDPSIVYAKGGRLLYMLKCYIGDDAFRAGLTAYFNTHKYGNTTGADLWAALGQSSGTDVAAFMNPWLERSGFPVITVDQDKQDIVLTQQHFLDNADKVDAERMWPVPLFGEIDTPQILDGRTIRYESSLTPLINKGGQGHYIVNYAQDSHKASLKKQVEDNILGEIDRLLLLNGSSMLSKSGIDSFGNTLQLLGAYRDEQSESVWSIMALILAEARRFVDLDESIEPKLKSLTRQLVSTEYERLGWIEKLDESSDDRKLRATIVGLGAYAEEPAIVSEALRLFDAYKSDTSVIAAELRHIIFTIAAKEDLPGAIDFLLDQYTSTTSSDLQRDIAGAITATRSQSVTERILELIKDDKIIKPQDADRWLFSMLRNRHIREQSWQWMEDNWDWIMHTYKQDKSYDYFPRMAAGVCNTGVWKERYHAFFDSKREDIVLKRNIDIGTEEIAARVAWLERDMKSVSQALSSYDK